ncbi:MAG: FecR domain-containing protein [Gammaproteobacteria bacterium]|nr:FecR domain-containing protein [Gammaproteobacteria bacterium]
MLRNYLAGLLVVLAMVVMPGYVAAAEKAQTQAIGKVIAVRGEAKAVNPSGEYRELNRGAKFYEGDKLVTFEKSSIKVRFIDGTLNSLRPNTVLHIKEFKFKRGAQSNKGFFILIKGGLKVVTGLINSHNPDAYKIKTPVGVIGVRGTILEIWLIAKKLYGILTSGTVSITTASGQVQLLRGGDTNNAFTMDDNGAFKATTPKELISQPCG